METGETLLKIALTPFTDGLNTEPNFFSDGSMRHPFGCHQNDTGPRDKAMRKRSGIDYQFQVLMFLLRKNQRSFGSTSSHGLSPFAIKVSP
jgi:hypothetical protein